MSADFDREIDRAVHEMLDVEPPANLRDGVLARIEEPAPRRGWIWLTVPLGAVALVLLAILMRPAPAPTTAVPVARAEQPVAGLPPEGGGHTTAVEDAHHRSEPGEARRPIARRAGSKRVTWPLPSGVTSAAAPSVTVAPLSDPAPIAVQPVEPRPIERSEVRIAALPAITPIAIEPLPEGGRH